MGWQEFEDRYGETKAEHICPDCGGWDCPGRCVDRTDTDEDEEY